MSKYTLRAHTHADSELDAKLKPRNGPALEPAERLVLEEYERKKRTVRGVGCKFGRR